MQVSTGQFFRKSPAEQVPGHGRGLFAGQGQVADDNADPLPIELVNPAIPESLVTRPQQQAKHRIKAAQKVGIDLQALDCIRVAFIIDVATLF